VARNTKLKVSVPRALKSIQSDERGKKNRGS
jgi:hypothetical protein